MAKTNHQFGVMALLLWAMASSFGLYLLLAFRIGGEPNFAAGGIMPYVYVTLSVLIGHVLALILPMYLMLRIYGPQTYPQLRSNLLAVAGVQVFWRWQSVAWSHIDCSNSCVSSITPQTYDNILILITAGVLIGVSLLAAKRYGLPVNKQTARRRRRAGSR